MTLDELHDHIRNNTPNFPALLKEYLSKEGHTINDAKPEDGQTLLMIALSIESFKLSTIKLLLEKGANPNLKNSEGKSAFFYIHDTTISVELAELLLGHGAQVNLECPIKHNPLYVAIEHNNEPLTLFLLSQGAILTEEMLLELEANVLNKPDQMTTSKLYEILDTTDTVVPNKMNPTTYEILENGDLLEVPAQHADSNPVVSTQLNEHNKLVKNRVNTQVLELANNTCLLGNLAFIVRDYLSLNSYFHSVFNNAFRTARPPIVYSFGAMVPAMQNASIKKESPKRKATSNPPSQEPRDKITRMADLFD